MAAASVGVRRHDILEGCRRVFWPFLQIGRSVFEIINEFGFVLPKRWGVFSFLKNNPMQSSLERVDD
jgi:hypothetical protein